MKVKVEYNGKMVEAEATQQGLSDNYKVEFSPCTKCNVTSYIKKDKLEVVE